MSMETSLKTALNKKGIAQLTLNCPEKHNAFDNVIIDEITERLKNWQIDDSVRALVIDARGDTFCAGADIAWMKRSAGLDYRVNLADAGALAEMMRCLDRFPVPIITLVQGAAFGGALGIICCSDIVLATEDARFCLSEVKLGIVPSVISPYVIRTMGERQARRYMLTAEMITASKALDLNLVHQLFASSDEARVKAEELLDTLLCNGPEAVRCCKQLIIDISGRKIDAGLVEYTGRVIADIRNTPEGQEGLTAFLEKRQPSWVVNR